MNNETKEREEINYNEENKLKSLSEIVYISDLNGLLNKFSVVNEFVKQAILYTSIKKGNKEKLNKTDLQIFIDKKNELVQIIEKIIEY